MNALRGAKSPAMEAEQGLAILEPLDVVVYRRRNMKVMNDDIPSCQRNGPSDSGIRAEIAIVDEKGSVVLRTAFASGDRILRGFTAHLKTADGGKVIATFTRPPLDATASYDSCCSAEDSQPIQVFVGDELYATVTGNETQYDFTLQKVSAAGGVTSSGRCRRSRRSFCGGTYTETLEDLSGKIIVTKSCSNESWMPHPFSRGQRCSMRLPKDVTSKLDALLLQTCISIAGAVARPTWRW